MQFLVYFSQGGIHVGSAPEVELQGIAIAPAAPAGGFHIVPLRQDKNNILLL